MRLFHKFLIALLIISIIPLIIYSVIILNTTGLTLKKVINENNVNITDNSVQEINKFFVEVEKKLDIARQIEKTPEMTNAQKGALLFKEITEGNLLKGIFLIDNNKNVVSGMMNDNSPYKLDNELISKSHKSGNVEIGSFGYTSDDIPFVDFIYPIDNSEKEYLYIRAGMGYLLRRIGFKINTEGKKLMSITIADRYNKTVTTPKLASNSIFNRDLEKYRKYDERTIHIEDKNMNITSYTHGPGWLVIFREPIKEAYAPITKMKVTAVSLVILTIFFSFYGAFILAKNLSRPISVLISGIEKIAIGNLDYQVPMVTNDELSKLVTIFNSMIIKLKKLQEDIKRGERLSTIGQMANILGHEIRNPLSSITNAIYLIKMEVTKNQESNPKMIKRIEIIETELKSTNKIINDMLDFSRSRPPVLTRVDINEVIQSILQDTRLPENVKIRNELGDVPKVSIDVEEIKQVFRNLVNNAIDSMEKNGGELTLITKKIFDDKTKKHYVLLEIKDTGCGMPPDVIEKIFEPFFSTKSKGTGLGLAVVKRIVEERHKGLIKVNSIIDKGTSFLIELPII